jgi:hypothetical protein
VEAEGEMSRPTEEAQRKARDLADEMADCVEFRRGEYAGFQYLRASRILQAALLRERAETIRSGLLSNFEDEERLMEDLLTTADDLDRQGV